MIQKCPHESKNKLYYALEMRLCPGCDWWWSMMFWLIGLLNAGSDERLLFIIYWHASVFNCPLMSSLVWKDGQCFGLSQPAATSGWEAASPPVGGVHFGVHFVGTSFWCAHIEENDILYNEPESEYEFRKAQMVTWARIFLMLLII